MKKSIRVGTVIVGILLTLSMSVYSASAAPNFDQTNRHKPVKAENIELVNKITLKGAATKPVKTTNLASTGIIGSSLPSGGKKYAVVIGISDYPGTVNDLQYADDDAIAMQNVLVNQYGFDFNNVKLLTNSTATYSNIITTIDNLRYTLAPNDELVFFYSGHGARGRAEDGDRSRTDQSIVVCNDDYSSLSFIWDGELKKLFSNFKTNRIVFIFDSCLSGGMSVLNGLGRVVNMACSTKGVSYEGSQWGGGHGQFSYYFGIDGMGLKAADSASNKDNVVTVEEAFDYAKANCLWQTPTISDGFQDDLLP